MRDIALILIFPVLIYYAIKRPYIGLALWLWSSLVPLNLWAYGFSTSFRWNLIFALTTIVSYFFSKKEFLKAKENYQKILSLEDAGHLHEHAKYRLALKVYD